MFVGTDPNVWWEGFEALREAMRAQAEAMGSGGLQIVSGQLQAYRERSVGWAVDRDASFRLPDVTEIPFRNTVVFLQTSPENVRHIGGVTMAENHVSKRRPIARKPRRHRVDEGLVVRFSATPIPLMCCRLYGEVCFLQEDSEWKLIHGHSSIGVSNEEMFGKDVTA